MAEKDNSPQIKNIKKEKLTDQIYHTLKALILSGRWPEGYRLPSEPELAAQFGVSRMSLRMALQKLQALGLIEVCVGSGTFVKRFSLDEYLEEISSLVFHTESPQKIAELRKALEVSGVCLAIDKYTPERLKELEEILERFHDAIRRRDIEEMIRRDVAFHNHIIETTDNELFIAVYHLSMDLMANYLLKRTMPIKSQPMLPDDYGFSQEKHTLLYQAILNRDKEEAQRLSYEIIDYSLTAME